MRITKFGHACVRIEHDGTTLVIDPGMFTQPEAVDGADAVLITHEHADHYQPDLLARTDAPVFTIEAVAAKIREEAPGVAERTTVVAPGQSFEASGLPVTAVNEKHAVIHPEFPTFDNSGYLVTAGDTTLFHPGDALDGPGRGVDILFLPVSAPWARASELVDFARAVKAPTNLAIHDRIYSDAGSAVFDGHLNAFLPKEGLTYHRLKDGEDL
ncbi:MBL fold metallo-hydrolase [Nocardioides sp. DS6]|uniref:MBL fold metallo-hydrolase n=1 Tax=Nocardioides eburneus TaxID=3231482 RepID=A0ABV3STD7_9ACTN